MLLPTHSPIPEIDPRLLTTAELAARSGLTRQTIRDRVLNRKLAAYRLRGRLLFGPAAVQAILTPGAPMLRPPALM